jgi:hypothetical protein
MTNENATRTLRKAIEPLRAWQNAELPSAVLLETIIRVSAF